MALSIDTNLSLFTSVTRKRTEHKSETMSTLLGTKGNSIQSLTHAVRSAQSDMTSISAVSKGVSDVTRAAKAAGISDEAMANVRTFAIQLQEEGHDTLSIMGYLGLAEDLATSDPDRFTEIFSGTNMRNPASSVTAAIDGAGT